jgi:anti-sigma factor RsiW
LTRPQEKHIDELELAALVAMAEQSTPSPSLFSDAVVEQIQNHVNACATCSAKLAKHIKAQATLNGLRVKLLHERMALCPENVNWVALASGFLPSEQTGPLMQHAADCGYCGAEFRDALEILSEKISAEEGQVIDSVQVKFFPIPVPTWLEKLREYFGGLVKIPILQPIAAILLAAVMIFGARNFFQPRAIAPALPGVTLSQFSSVAVQMHRERIQGTLQLDVKASRTQSVSDWIAANFSFDKKLPSLPPASDSNSQEAYQVEGASKVKVGSAYAALVIYRLPLEVTSLLMAPDSVAKAEGGVKVQYTKDLTFHYETIEGYKVVTWSIHGITYALVSGAEVATQKSCMVCHAAMNDQRDFSKTPFPTMPAANMTQ